MNVISIIMAVFAVLGGIDRILGNRFGIGKEFEKGFLLLGIMCLSMIGMIVIAPVISDLLTPVLNFTAKYLKLDPSFIPASIFSNDMGGAPLSVGVSLNEKIGYFNGTIVASMMGCTISYTLPLALGMVEKSKHNDMILGFLCGIVTIPLGCVVGGLMMGIEILTLLWNMLPIVLFAGIIALGLVFCPTVTVKIFSVLGVIMKAIITFGLLLGMLDSLLGFRPIKNIAPLSEGTMICMNASVVIAGAFPLINIVSRILNKPLKIVGNKMGIGSEGALSLLGTLATTTTTFELMNSMNRKAVVYNSAFLISGGFVFAGQLAFTLAYSPQYVLPFMVSKVVSAIFALVLAVFIYKSSTKKQEKVEI